MFKGNTKEWHAYDLSNIRKYILQLKEMSIYCKHDWVVVTIE